MYLWLICQLPLLGLAQIDTTQIVSLGGIRQFIAVQSNCHEAPLMLFLHGGPGRSFREIAHTFTDSLLDHFTVVQWDQRGAGKTHELNPENTALSAELLQSDTDELIRYLLQQFNRQKLYLVSHSWGSVMGFHVAQNHPELVHAYIAISPVVNQHEHSRLTIAMLKQWALETGNKTALTELDSVTVPLQEAGDLYYQQKWLFIHNGAEFASKPGFRNEYFTWMDTWFPLCIEAVDKPLYKTTPTLNCPVYFIEGNGDGQESHQLVEHYYQTLRAPIKELYWFDQSGHTVFNTEPDKLQVTLIGIGVKHTNATPCPKP